MPTVDPPALPRKTLADIDPAYFDDTLSADDVSELLQVLPKSRAPGPDELPVHIGLLSDGRGCVVLAGQVAPHTHRLEAFLYAFDICRAGVVEQTDDS